MNYFRNFENNFENNFLFSKCLRDDPRNNKNYINNQYKCHFRNRNSHF